MDPQHPRLRPTTPHFMASLLSSFCHTRHIRYLVYYPKQEANSLFSLNELVRVPMSEAWAPVLACGFDSSRKAS